MNPLHNHIKQPYTFPDGVVLEILQIKTRDNNVEWVTYNTTHRGALPKKHTIPILEFIDNFGHLYGLKEIPNQP
jgi:hypothetical protein